MRKIFIGDVHGCIDELNSLINLIEFNPNKDQLYFTGDLICRGYSSKDVWLRCKELKAKAVIGNKELYLIHFSQGKYPYQSWIKKLELEFGFLFEEFIKDIQNWPVWIEEENFILVHGGLVPDQKIIESTPKALTTIRTWDGCGDDLQNPNNPPWFNFYHDQKLVVFGHWAALEGVYRDNVIGLDTGCVYGKKLTALILPEKKIVSVSANQVYCSI